MTHRTPAPKEPWSTTFRQLAGLIGIVALIFLMGYLFSKF